MKRILLLVCLPFVFVACTSTTSQQGLKKSPCACVYKPVPSSTYLGNVA